VPVGCCEAPGPLGVGWGEPDAPVVGGGVGGLELVVVRDVGGDGELWVGDGTLTEGTLTDGTLTDGTLIDGVLIVGSGNDEESAGDAAIAVIAPNIPAPTDAKHHFLRLDTRSELPAASDRRLRLHVVGRHGIGIYPQPHRPNAGNHCPDARRFVGTCPVRDGAPRPKGHVWRLVTSRHPSLDHGLPGSGSSPVARVGLGHRNTRGLPPRSGLRAVYWPRTRAPYLPSTGVHAVHRRS
jgi:hypothetical protein